MTAETNPGNVPLVIPPADGATTALTVAELIEHPRRPGRYLLTISDARTFTLSVSLLADLGATRKGVILEPVVIARLELEAGILHVMDKAVASLSRGRRTRRELEVRLKRAKPGVVPPRAATIATALDRLVESGLVDDESVARAEASSRLRRGDAPFRVRQILQQKGIDRGVAAEAVAHAVQEDEIDEGAQCIAVAARRMKSLAKLEPTIARRRLTAFLIRRGYGSDSIRLAVREHFASR
jgi:regulatory protein